MANSAVPPPEAAAAALTTPSVLHDDSLDPTLAALSTLSLLNLRLSRLEHLLTGHDANVNHYNTASSSSTLPPPLQAAHHNASMPTSTATTTSTNTPSPKPTLSDIPSQLHHLETRLAALKRMDGLPGSLVRMVDTLRREYPDLFLFSSTSSSTSTSAPTTHQLSRQATSILAHAALYTSTSSRLQTLQTLRIPPATVSTNIVAQGGRMKKLLARQDMLAARAEALQERSVAVLQWWVDVGVRGMGEVWEDWEDRVLVCERFVKIYERRAREETGEAG